MQKISELLEAAAERAFPVIDGIVDDDLARLTPCTEYDVRALLDHLFQVVVNFQALAADGAVDFSEVPESVVGDWRARFREETAKLVAAWAAPGAEEGTKGAMGFEARTVGNMVLSDLTIHAWDLARATGQEYVADESVLDEIGPAVAAMAPQGREAKVYGEPYPVPEGAGPLERMLALTGRDPGWRPPGA